MSNQRDEAEALCAYIEELVRSLTDPGAEVEVEHQAMDGGHVYLVLVSESSVRFVIGRGGRVADAIRVIAQARATARGLVGVNLQLRGKRSGGA